MVLGYYVQEDRMICIAAIIPLWVTGAEFEEFTEPSEPRCSSL